MRTLSNVRFWSVGRTIAQIQANMFTSTPSGTGLIANWRLDEGSGQIAKDATGVHNGMLGTTPSVESTDPAWIAAP